MCAIKSSRSGRVLEIEAVGSWHSRWQDILRGVERQGSIKRLKIDADGWLSARQVLLAAFVGDVVAAHICFSVTLDKSGRIGARLASHGIDPRFTGRGIESQLHQAAVDRARSLRCVKLKGFKLNSTWC